MSTCRDARRWMERALTGELAIEDELRLEEHARGCPRCRDAAARGEALREALLGLPAPPLERVDVERHVRAVRAVLEAGDAQAAERPARLRRAAGWLAAAGVVAATALALVLGARERPAARPDPLAVGIASAPRAEPASPPPDEAPSSAIPDASDPAGSDPAAPPAPALDRERLAHARAQVREWLLDAAARARGADGELDAGVLARSFDEATAALSRWPVVRLVEGVAAGADSDAARAALRWLGRRGDRASRAVLVAALERPDAKRAAARALAELPDGAGDAGLARAAWDDELAPLVLAHAAALEPEHRRRFVTSALRLGPGERGRADGTARALLGALGDEPQDARALLALRGQPTVDDALLLEALAPRAASDEALLEAIAADRHGETEFLLRAVARRHPPDALAWVRDQCRARRHRAEALKTLAGFDAAEALEALMAVEGGFAPPADELDAAWSVALDRPGEELARVARLWLGEADARRCEALLARLVATGRAQAVEAVLVLAASPLVGVEHCERAAWMAGELGDASHVAALHELLESLDRDQAHVAAAALWSLHRVGGAREVRAALAALDARRRERIEGLLDGADAPSSVLGYRLARELEPWLERPRSTERETS